MTIIYKITTKKEWQTAIEKGEYKGSTDDQRDGFIHFSTRDQLEGTLSKHFNGQDDLLLLAFNEQDLAENLKWEPSRGGALFPHLFAPLPTRHVLWEKPLAQNSDGSHILELD